MSSFIIISIILTNAIPTTVFASSKIQQTKELSKSNNSIKQSKKDSITFDYQAKGVSTKIIKAAIKFIKKNRHAATKVVEKVSGKTVAKNFLKYYDKVVIAFIKAYARRHIPELYPFSETL